MSSNANQASAKAMLSVVRATSNFVAPRERAPRRGWRGRPSPQPSQPVERQQLETLFLDNLPVIERIIAAASRRYGLMGADAEDAASWLKLRIVQDDYAVLEKFRGESTLATYLTVVIAMLFRDYRVQQWGRWHPSAAARREGAIAVKLEMLVMRDGIRLAQAGHVLRARGDTNLSDAELSRIVSKLPARAPLRPVIVDSTVLPDAASTLDSEELVHRADTAAQWAATDATMQRAVQELNAEDRLIVHLRYWDGLSVAEISRAIGAEQKQLYRRMERLLARLRTSLEAAGVSKERARVILADINV